VSAVSVAMVFMGRRGLGFQDDTSAQSFLKG
jgi:hypothetical protein